MPRGGARPGAGRKPKAGRANPQPKAKRTEAPRQPGKRPETPEDIVAPFKARCGPGKVKYTPDMPSTVLTCGLDGMTVVEMAATCGVTRKTLYQWAKSHEEFGAAFDEARELAEAVNAYIYRKGCQRSGKEFNAHAFGRFMATVYPEWRVAERVEMTGRDGGPIETREMTDRELAQRVAFLLHRAQSDGQRGADVARH